jgi:spore germination protein KB
MSIYWLIIGVFYCATLFLAIPYMKIENLLPLGEAGFAAIIKSSVVPFAYYGEFFILAMILPYLKNPREGLKAGNIANIILTIFLTTMVISMITVLGVDTTSRSIFALFFLGDYIPPIGIKIYLLSMWVVAFWGKIMLLQFIICSGLSQLLNLKSYRYVILPVAALLVVLSFNFYRSVPIMLISIPATFPGVALFFEYLIPTLLLVIAWIKLKFSNNASSAPATNMNSQS